MGMISYIRAEADVIRARDPAIKSNVEVLLYPGFRAILAYRISHRLYLKKHYFLARWISQRAARKTGIEIHPGAVIGERLFIDHGNGVVIGETAWIGNDVTMYHGVTLGGVGITEGKRHPTIQDGVMIGTGAKILGNFTVGKKARIGAGTVVLTEVPPGATVVGAKGTVIKAEEQRKSEKERKEKKICPYLKEPA